jgi:phosphopantothenoylcysteine synthetase/decarboxylase
VGSRIAFGFADCAICKGRSDHWALEDLLAPLRALRDKVAALGLQRVSVNLSTRDLLDQDLLAHAQAKRERKGVPLLVGNIGPQTFGLDDNALLLVDAQGTKELPRAPKLQLACRLIERIAQDLRKTSS